jgi:hypothetical protein
VKSRRPGRTTLAQAIAYMSLGFVAAFLGDLWPERGAVTQMLLFSVMVFAPLALSFWQSRKVRLLQYGVVCVVFAHVGVLWSCYGRFPARSIWSIVPLALCESIAFAALGFVLLNMAQRRTNVID